MNTKYISNNIRLNEEKGDVYFVDKNGKLKKIGELTGTHFVCKRKPENIFRKINAYGFNYSLINNLEIETIQVLVSDGRILNTTSEILKQNGKKMTFYGEEQIFLPLQYFN